MMASREPSSKDDTKPQEISDEVGHESAGTTTPSPSSFSGSPSPPSSVPSSSPPTDDETDEGTLNPPAESGSQIHTRNDDDTGACHKSSQGLPYEFDTVRGGAIAPSRSSLHVAPTPTPSSSLPSSSQPTDDETNGNILIAGSCYLDLSTTESEDEDDVIAVHVAGEITHSATGYQVHPDETVSMNTAMPCLQEGSEVSPSYEAQGNGSDQSFKLRKLQDDGCIGGNDIIEEVTDAINQDDGGDVFPPPPPLPGQVVEATSPTASPARKPKHKSWYERLGELRKYKEENGHCNVPVKQGTLGWWVQSQRRHYRERQAGRNTPLTDDRVAALDAIDFQWDGRNTRDWYEWLGDLRKYKGENGHCIVPKSQGPLGRWVRTQRNEYHKRKAGKQTALTEERVAALNAMSFQWDGTGANLTGNIKDDLWNKRLRELDEYKEVNGNCNVPAKGGPLGKWVETQRSNYRKKKAGVQSPLTDKRIAALDAIGFEWDGTGAKRSGSINDDRWKERVNELRKHKERNGHCNVPQSQGTLGTWVSRQRVLYRKREDGEQTPLTDERIAALEEIGFQWKLK